MSKIPQVTLIPTNICVLGKGAYGRVCIQKTKTGKKYAVKEYITGNNNNTPNTQRENNALKSHLLERKQHFKFYYNLPAYLKRFFPKPYKVKDAITKTERPGGYAMAIVPNAVELGSYITKASDKQKLKAIKQVRQAVMALWTSGYIHGDMHMGNILVNSKTGNIKIIDFGFMKKSVNTPPSKKWRVKDVDYTKLNNKWNKWFKKEWPIHLDHLLLSESNPNMVVFPKYMGNLKFYAWQYVKNFKNLNKIMNNSKPKPAGITLLASMQNKKMTRKQLKEKWSGMNKNSKLNFLKKIKNPEKFKIQMDNI